MPLCKGRHFFLGYIYKKKKPFKDFLTSSERGDSNARPLRPERSALPTALLSDRFRKWCHQESNRGHKDFQSFALPTELWHHHFLFADAKVDIYFESPKFFQKNIEKVFLIENNTYLCIRKTESESSAVGSALRSGRRGRAFESPLSDQPKRGCIFQCILSSF